MWIVEIAFLHVYYFIFKLKTWYFCEISAVIQAYCHTVGNNHIQAVYNSSGTYKCMPFPHLSAKNISPWNVAPIYFFEKKSLGQHFLNKIFCWQQLIFYLDWNFPLA